MIDTRAAQAVHQHGAQQDEQELGMLLDLLEHRFPLASVLEIGSDQGGMLWLWGHLAKRVVAVTLHTRTDKVFESHGALVVEGNSLDQDVRDQAVTALCGVGADLVFVDGGHQYVTARRDIEWARTMAPRGLVVVHDIYPNRDHADIETYLAWGMFAEQLPHVEICRQRGTTPGYGILGLGS